MKRCFLLIAVISLVPVIDGRFSISRQYRTEREKGPFVITFDESQDMATPKEIWEEAQSVRGREARQTSGQQDPSTTSYLLRADNQRYAIVHWDGLPETVSILVDYRWYTRTTRSLFTYYCYDNNEQEGTSAQTGGE